MWSWHVVVSRRGPCGLPLTILHVPQIPAAIVINAIGVAAPDQACADDVQHLENDMSG
jgi:hypothetical protein